MKRPFALLFILASLTCQSQAQPARSAASVADLRAGDFGSAQNLTLSGFYPGSPKGGGILTATSGSSDDGCMVFADKAGHIFRRSLDGRPLDVTMCGARCGGTQVGDGRSSAGSPVITSATARWTKAMLGWRAVVTKAGVSGQQIDTTVAAIDGAGTLRLALPAGTTGSGETVSVYPDDTVALDAAFAAAGKARIAVQLPAGAVCGYANPGASVFKTVAGQGLYLNSGTLWLGHTGPAMDTGVGLHFTANGSVLKGPGVISGLYQTNQNTGQYNTSAILFTGTAGSAIRGPITLENSKGRAFLAEDVKDFAVTDVTVRACGDFAYHPPAGVDIMTGRSMCGQVTAPKGTLIVKNYTGVDAAQAGFLLFGPTDAAFRAEITNCHFSGNGFYGLDVEEVAGTVAVSDCEQTGNGQPPSAGLTYGGFVFRDVAHFSASNLKSSLTDSNAFVIQSADAKANLQDWSINGLTLTGTPASHGATLYVAFQYSGVPQRVSLRNVTYDNWTMYVNGAPCTRAAPRQQILSFENVRASGLYKGTQSELDFQANPGTMTYVEGRNSDLGVSTFKPLTGNQAAIFQDLAGVRGSGAAARSTAFGC
jgi:hypothetical protein